MIILTDEQRKKIIEKIAYHRSEERKRLKLNGSSKHDWNMAEIDLMNYEFFKQEFDWIDSLIKDII